MLLPTRHPRGSRRGRRGASAVEFMAILPVLTTLLLAGIDFGMFGFRYLQVQNAALAAANYGATTPYDASSAPARMAWETEVATRAKDEMFARSETGRRNRVVPVTTVTVQDVPNSARVRLVGVVVTYDFNTIVNWPMLPRTVLLRGAAQVRSIR